MGRRKRKKKYTSKNRDFWYAGSDDDMILFYKWLARRGFKNCEPLIPCYFTDTGRGLQTRRLIEANKPIITIPKSMIITADSIKKSDLRNMFSSCSDHVILSPPQVLSCFLLWEKFQSEGSTWFPYINLLPKSIDTPIFLTSEEKLYLPHFLLKEISLEKNVVKHAIMKVLPLFEKHLLLNGVKWDCDLFKEFLWAWSIITSRSISVRAPSNCDRKTTMGLIPFLDLLNHSQSAEVTVSETENDFIIYTKSRIPSHNQVFVNYGSHSNVDLYVNYGFVEWPNHNETVHLTLDDVSESIKRSRPGFRTDRITPDKEHFLRSRSLTTYLGLTLEGLTFNMRTLICVVCMDVFSIDSTDRLFQEEYSDVEKQLLYSVGCDLVDRQAELYESYLNRMREVQHTSDSFSVAKKLLELRCYQLLPSCKTSLHELFCS